MNVREQLKSLAAIYLARATALTSPYVAQTIRLKADGDATARTERKTIGRYTSRRLLFRHHLTVDPTRVEAAWSLLGTQTLGDAIVLDAELVSRVPSIGAIYRWTGVQQSGLKANVFRHFVAILPGANVPDVRICAKSEKLALRYAADYLDRIPETDWNRENIWMSPYSTPITDVTNVSVNRHGGVLLHGRWMQHVWWKDGTDRALLPGCVWHQQADDGQWIQGDRPHDLAVYYKWRNEQRAASAPPSIPDEDLEAFVL